ncbi:MAG: leucyl aminopeptidase [Bdellovibrionales bacterium]
MKVTLRKSATKPADNQTLVFFVSAFDNSKKLSMPKLDKAVAQLLQSASEDEAFSGKRKESVFFRQTNAAGYKHLLAVGLGDGRNLSAEDARVAVAVAMKALSAQKVSRAILDLDSLLKVTRDTAGVTRAVAEALHLVSYEFTDYKSKPKKPEDKKDPKPSEVAVETKTLNKTVEAAFDEGEVLATETNYARWLGDHAANTLTPTILAKRVQEKAKNSKIKVSVWDKAKIEKENFGGLWGVGQGSEEDPRFIIMQYNGAGKGKKPIYLVGKGLTFDSGGISIKPSAAMDEMKYDMCGAAAVIGATFALAKMKAKVNVVTLVAAAENMPSGRSVKPGDIFVHRNGKTTEVLNTDAEGRLVLADALAYASEHKPQAIFDAATLTGAIVVALGNTHTGVFTRDNKLMKRIYDASETAGEVMWQMPVTDDHLEDMRGAFADLSNISSFKGAGSATAAAFLEQFVDKEIPYAHFDIAGTAWNVSNRLPYIAKKGASGVLVRTFVELAKSYF